MSEISKLDEVMDRSPVMPVLVVKDLAQARPLAEELVAAGLSTLEVTLRTDCALDVISEMSKVEGSLVGAGTVLNAQQAEQAVKAGAKFLVSPGLTQEVVDASRKLNVPLLPGVANASDIMRGLEMGLRRFKFFPAMVNGGIPALKGYISVFGSQGLRFCPTGGITEATYKDWLAIDGVACVGGSWITSGDATPAEAGKRARALGIR